jgi:hypothetical protein
LHPWTGFGSGVIKESQESLHRMGSCIVNGELHLVTVPMEHQLCRYEQELQPGNPDGVILYACEEIGFFEAGFWVLFWASRTI